MSGVPHISRAADSLARIARHMTARTTGLTSGLHLLAFSTQRALCLQPVSAPARCSGPWFGIPKRNLLSASRAPEPKICLQSRDFARFGTADGAFLWIDGLSGITPN